MKIIEYQEKYKKYFIEFNTDWIEENFGSLEAEDIVTFNHIDESLEKAAMEWAIHHGAGRLFILSNSKLKTALHIYEKYGFHEIKLEDYEYIRGDIAFEYIVS